MFSDHKEIKLEINIRVLSGITPNISKQNNTLQKNPWFRKDIKREIQKFIKLNENENKTYTNLLNATKAALRRTLTILYAYIRRQNICKSVTSVSTLKY